METIFKSELMSERGSIPYRFMPIPYEFLTNDFLKDHEMMLFIICMMRRISPNSKTIPLKNHCKQLLLGPFEFMFGRKNFSKDAGISEKIVRTRLEQLIGLGYVSEVVIKRASTFRVYRLVTESFHQISGQHEGQLMVKKKDQNLGHKREAKTQNKENKKETFNVNTPLSSQDNDDLTAILAYCDANELRIQRPSLERWIRVYKLEKVLPLISLLVPSKSTVRNHESWMEKALEKDYVTQNKNSEANRKFSEEFKKSHIWNDLTIRKRYCRHEPSGKDYYFNLPQDNFRENLKNCYELYNDKDP